MLQPTAVMASRLTFHSQLSSIMETMARTVLSQVCKLVDEDSTELRLELSRLLAANSSLVERVNSLEGELTAVRGDAPKFGQSYRSVGVQTVCRSDGEADGEKQQTARTEVSGFTGVIHPHCLTSPQRRCLPPSRGFSEKTGAWTCGRTETHTAWRESQPPHSPLRG